MTTPSIQGALEDFVADLLGREPQITHRWAGIFGLVLDFLPVVGPVPGRDGVWVAGGYSGHGNVLGLRAASSSPAQCSATETRCSSCSSRRGCYIRSRGTSSSSSSRSSAASAIARSWIARPVESKTVASSSLAAPGHRAGEDVAELRSRPRAGARPPRPRATSSPLWLACSQSSQKTRDARELVRRRSPPCRGRRHPSGSRAAGTQRSLAEDDLPARRHRDDEVGGERLLAARRLRARRARRGHRRARDRRRRPRAATSRPRATNVRAAARPFTPAPITAAVAASRAAERLGRQHRGSARSQRGHRARVEHRAQTARPTRRTRARARSRSAARAPGCRERTSPTSAARGRRRARASRGSRRPGRRARRPSAASSTRRARRRRTRRAPPRAPARARPPARRGVPLRNGTDVRA